MSAYQRILQRILLESLKNLPKQDVVKQGLIVKDANNIEYKVVNVDEDGYTLEAGNGEFTRVSPKGIGKYSVNSKED
tara:strand:+ start:389 stop:619 length:231 start_codon:yes stop_codon:yes gene_type:complete